jgi:threonyl-tRNA synthetase
MNITDKQSDFVQQTVEKLNKSGFRAKSDLRNEKIGFKIREHTLKRIPYLLVVGDKEVEQNEVAVRTRSGEDLGKIKVDDFIAKLSEEVSNRA